MPAWTRTAVLQEPLTPHLTQRACLHQVQEKGMRKPSQREQLEPVFPRPDAHTLEPELTFVHAPDLLDLPAVQIGQSYPAWASSSLLITSEVSKYHGWV
jgi:hypothetical protein